MVVNSFCLDHCKDMCQRYLEHPRGSQMHWDSAPDHVLMSQCFKLAEEYCTIAPNTKIPKQKHLLALESHNSDKSLNKTGKSDQDFYDLVDTKIRMLLSKFKVAHLYFNIECIMQLQICLFLAI